MRILLTTPGSFVHSCTRLGLCGFRIRSCMNAHVELDSEMIAYRKQLSDSSAAFPDEAE